MNKSSELKSWEHHDYTALDLELEEFFSDLPARTQLEERLNAWSHGIFSMAYMFGFAYLMYCALNSTKDYAVESAFVYGLSLVLLFGASALYHGATEPLLKKKMRILDHCAIFLFIAGNYTPVLLLLVGGEIGWALFGFQWTLAMFGVFLKMKFTGKYDWFFVALFVAMAWSGVVLGDYIRETLPTEAFNWLIIGGIVYMLGIIFYKSEEKIPHAHLIWHVFVIAGSLIHYVLMVRYVF